jgi:diguanylate cyclase
MVDRVSDESAGGWREKYLDLLDEHEVLEHRSSEQLYLLTRALVRVSISADGQDKDLDAALERLRDQLRRGEVADLPALLERVDNALLAFEEQRNQHWTAIAAGLNDTIKPLQTLSLTRSINDRIQQFSARIPEDVKQFHAYPALLKALSLIYDEVVEQLRTPDTGLLGKIFGRPAPATSATQDDDPVEMEAVAIDEPVEAPAPLLAVPPPTLAALVEKIHRILTRLLDTLYVPDHLQSRSQELRLRLVGGESEETLLATLETTGQLISEASLAANEAFTRYLTSVNQELNDIYAVISGEAERHQSLEAAARQWQESMLSDMSDLEKNSDEASDLNQLKSLVNSRLGNIRQALKNYQQSEQQQKKMSGQLQELAKRIRAMEVEAKENRTALEKHRHKALHDPLTGLPNREAYNERMGNEYQRWLRYRHPLTVAICDLDHFKKINDNFGHQAGDRVLRFISRSISKRLREIDFFGRIGGEEFVFIMPDTTRDQAFVVLEKIRSSIAATEFNYKNEPLPITLSIGITQFIEGDRTETAMGRADVALYQAKNAGRNRCQIL